MKILPFAKMAGAGNDFIVIDAAPGLNYKSLARKACDRTSGIGADGLLVLDRSRRADYKMRIINADGSEAEMCGNGARCLAAYIVRSQRPSRKLFTMETLAGIVSASASGGAARIQLTPPSGYATDIAIDINGRMLHVSFIDTGVPHVVVFVDGLAGIDVAGLGRVIRYHERFRPRGTNVDFVEEVDERFISVRTYERGVEGETKACGTGSVAAAIIAYLKMNPAVRDKKAARMSVRTSGGEVLEVTFDIGEGQVRNVWLKGNVHFIAKGEYYA